MSQSFAHQDQSFVREGERKTPENDDTKEHGRAFCPGVEKVSARGLE